MEKLTVTNTYDFLMDNMTIITICVCLFIVLLTLIDIAVVTYQYRVKKKSIKDTVDRIRQDINMAYLIMPMSTLIIILINIDFDSVNTVTKYPLLRFVLAIFGWIYLYRRSNKILDELEKRDFLPKERKKEE